MSAFRRKVDQLQSELLICIKLCKDIRRNRTVGSSHYHLDQFQTALEFAKEAIPVQYDTIRTALGFRFDAGDDKARAEMADHILDIEADIRPKLLEISQPDGPRRPGFSRLLERWNQIYKGLSKTIYNLSRRIEESAPAKPPVVEPAPTPAPKPAPMPKANQDEVTIKMKDLDFFLEHVKNSWEEENIDGMIRYINVFDASRRQWERPANAYIKTASRPARGPGNFSRRNSGW